MKKKVIICSPGANFPMAWVHAYVQFIFDLQKNYEVESRWGFCCNIYDSRNAFMIKMHEEGLKADYVLWIDHDNLFNIHTFNLLREALDSRKDAIGVGGWYFINQEDPVIAAGFHDQVKHRPTIDDIQNAKTLIEVAYIGLGFFLCHFDRLMSLGRRPFDPQVSYHKDYVCGDDVSFCRLAQEKGFKTYLDPRVFLPHLKLQPIKYIPPDPNKIYLEDIDGWMSEEELNWLYHVAEKAESVVEIGSWKGRSTQALLSGCKGKIYAVDHFQGSPNEQENHKEALQGTIYEQFMKNVGHFPNLEVRKMSSKEAAESFEGQVDVVFIDGGHTYEEVLEDISLWWGKAKKMICGHDINWPGVEKAVKEAFPDFKRGAGVIWFYEIPQ